MPAPRRALILDADPRPGCGAGFSSVEQEASRVSEQNMQLFVAVFDDEQEAKAALSDFKDMDREGSLELIDAAVIVRAQDGKVRFEETADPSGKKWAKRGAIAGGVVGLIFPP